MRAVVYHGPGRKAWEEVPTPVVIDDTDAVVRVEAVTICGTDLHILKGDVPSVTEGRVLGHEAVGTVVETGAAVAGLKEGDRVLVPAITSRGRCSPCKHGMAAHCEAVGGIGWIFGHLIDGVQAEYARVPYAETSVHLLPEGASDEQVLFLSDILPTGYEIGVQNSGVGPGDTVAVVGAGPVGLAAMMTGAIAGASRITAVDLAASRLKHSEAFGATHTVMGGDGAEERIEEITGGEGVDVAIEAVGIPATFDLCTRIVKPGGTVANIGVTARRPRCTSRTCGSRTSRSRPASSAAPPFRRCCNSCATAASPPRSSARTASRSARSWRPTTCSPRRTRTTR